MTPAPSHETVDERYARELGEAAFERQKRERGERHPCCGELVADGHHLACSKRPADDPPCTSKGRRRCCDAFVGRKVGDAAVTVGTRCRRGNRWPDHARVSSHDDAPALSNPDRWWCVLCAEFVSKKGAR